MTALICDIDGVLLHDNRPIPGAGPTTWSRLWPRSCRCSNAPLATSRTNGESRSGVGTESLEELDLSGVVEIVGGHAADEGADRGPAA